MKKSIANKIERLLCALKSGTEGSKNNTTYSSNETEEDNLHYEKNPDRPVKTKLPARLLELIRPKRNPEFR